MIGLTLFHIAAEYRAITDVLMDSGCDEQTLKDTLEGEAWALEVKAQNYGFVIRNLEASADAIDEAAKAMLERAKSQRNRAAYMMERLKTGMQIAGVTKLECPYFAISLKKNPDSVDVFEPALVPAEYWRNPEILPPTLDKRSMSADMKAGKEIPGAKLINDAVRLEIK